MPAGTFLLTAVWLVGCSDPPRFRPPLPRDQAVEMGGQRDAGPPDGGDAGGMRDVGSPPPPLSHIEELWSGETDVADLRADEDSVVWRTHAPFQVLVLDPGAPQPRVLDAFPTADSVTLAGMTHPYIVLWVDEVLWAYDVRPGETGRDALFGDYGFLGDVSVAQGNVYALVSATHYARVDLTDGMVVEYALPAGLNSPLQLVVSGAFAAVTYVPMPDQDAWGVAVFDRSTNTIVANDLQWQTEAQYFISAMEEDATIFGENVVPHDGAPPYAHGQTVADGTFAQQMARADTVRRGWRYSGGGREPIRFGGLGQQLASFNAYVVTHATDLVPNGVIWAAQNARITDEHGDTLDEPEPFGPTHIVLIPDVRGERCALDAPCVGAGVACIDDSCAVTP